MKFRPGDRVVAIKAYGPVEAGDTGEYVHTHKSYPEHGVRWDKKSLSKHSCSYHCERGYGFYLPGECLMLDDIPDLGELPAIDSGKIDYLFRM